MVVWLCRQLAADYRLGLCGQNDTKLHFAQFKCIFLHNVDVKDLGIRHNVQTDRLRGLPSFLSNRNRK
jgi:hypothetical protein